MSRAELPNEISLKEFRILLRNDEFLDYFNKFTSLPVFCQLVICKKNDDILFDPPFRGKQYCLNGKGLAEWLWKKRCFYFVKTRFYVEYLLARRIMKYSLCRNDVFNLSYSEREAVRESLRWLLKKCFGRVSAFRHFLLFLRRSSEASKLYQFWIGAERLYQYVKCQSSVSTEKMKSLKQTFFYGGGDMKFSEHVLDAAWKKFSVQFRLRKQEYCERNYGITFTIFMQQFCFEKLCSYWVPRYIFSANIKVMSRSDAANYEVSLQYLKGKLPQKFMREIRSSQSCDSSCTVTGTSDTEYEGELEMITSSSATTEKDARKKSLEPKRKKYTRRQTTTTLFSAEAEVLSLKSTESLVREKSSSFSSFVEEQETSSSATTAEGSRRGKPIQNKERFSKTLEDPATKSELSSGETLDIETTDEDELNKRFEERRQLSLEERVLRFHEVLLNTSFKREVIKTDAAFNVIKSRESKENLRTKKIVFDNARDVLATTSSIEQSKFYVEKEEEPKASERKLSEGRPETHDFDYLEGKGLLKAALQIPHQLMTNASDDSFTESSDSLYDDDDLENITSQLTRKSIDYGELEGRYGPVEGLPHRVLTPKLTPQSRDGEDQQLAVLTVLAKKRRTANRPQLLQKKKITTYTFSLSGSGQEKLGHIYLKQQKKKKKRKKRKHKTRRADQDSKRLMFQQRYSVGDKIGTLPQDIFEPVYTLAADEKFRRDPYINRMVAALQTDHAAGNPFYQYLLTSDNDEMINCLNFWQDVEKSRIDYSFGDMSYFSFVKSLRSIVANYLLRNSPHAIVASENLKKTVNYVILSTDVIEMPWELRKLQAEALEDLVECYESYLKQDLQTFYNVVASRHKEVSQLVRPNRGRNLYGITLPPISSYADGVAEKTSEDLESELKKEIHRRMLRAQRIVLECHLPSGRELPKPEEYNEEEDSDEEGRVKTPPPPKLVIEPPVDMTTLASMSIREYWDQSASYTLVISRPKKSLKSENYFKTLHRGGVLLRRPLTRPLSLNEVLKDYIHLEFFKKYLKAHRVDGALSFCLAVESLRNTENMKQRQMKAKNIIKRYFQNPKVPATKLLQCNADVVKEIPYLDIVTTTMLTLVQTAVAKSLETDWFRRYADTFTDIVPIVSSTEGTDEALRARSKRFSTSRFSRAWTAFMEFIKRASLFICYMKKPHFVKHFSEFLKRQPLEYSLENTQGDAKHKAADWLSKSQTKRFQAEEFDITRLQQQAINGHVVTLNHLENDLQFWLEIARYNALTHNASPVDSTKPLSRTEEGKLLKMKASLIVKCYLNSSIPPSCRVNVPSEVCDITIDTFHNNVLDRTLFHEATIYIFPLLMIFWKKFCDQRYKYSRPLVTKAIKKIYGYKLTPAHAALGIEEKQQQKIEKEIRRSKGLAEQLEVEEKRRSKLLAHMEMYHKEFKRSSVHLEEAPETPTMKGDGFPDYRHLDPSKIRKLRGSPSLGDDMTSRITFSISRGVTMIQPIKHRKYTILKSDSREVRFVLDSATNEKQKPVSRRKSSAPKYSRKRSTLTESESFEKLPAPVPQHT